MALWPMSKSSLWRSLKSPTHGTKPTHRRKQRMTLYLVAVRPLGKNFKARLITQAFITNTRKLFSRHSSVSQPEWSLIGLFYCFISDVFPAPTDPGRILLRYAGPDERLIYNFSIHLVKFGLSPSCANDVIREMELRLIWEIPSGFKSYAIVIPTTGKWLVSWCWKRSTEAETGRMI
jgi:hypothetical protein